MSFYGQVRYEFSKLFDKIKIKKNNLNNEASAPAADEILLQPDEKWDTLNFESSDRWIALNANLTDKIITFGHNEPGEADDTKTAVGFQQILASDIPPEGKVIPLNRGDFIKTTVNQYDKTGHATGEANVSYFKLPEDEDQLILDETIGRVDNIEKYYLAIKPENTPGNDEYNNDDGTGGLSISKYLADNGYLDNTSVETKLGEYLLDNNYVTKELTGDLSNMNTTDNTSEWTITETIGDMNSSNENSVKSALDTILEVPAANREETSYSVSNAMIELIGLISKQQGSIDSLVAANIGISALNAKIIELENRIETLEAYHHEIAT